jgi:5-deoxy-glucuronate isomerase
MSDTLSSETSTWKITTPDTPGFHTIVTPENSPCRALWFFRLNLAVGQSHLLQRDDLELNAAVINGRIDLIVNQSSDTLERFDSFYLPGGLAGKITAHEETVIYIGGATYVDEGEFFIRRYDSSMPLGEIRQIHGEPPYRREVFMTINQEVPGSRLICGLTWGDEGAWTSWPPHQHDKDLEEVYCYFDLPSPKFALHLSYTAPGELASVHQVSSGDCVLIPHGYHPTVAMPGVRSSYFWVMAAHNRASRRYDLAINDPNFDNT